VRLALLDHIASGTALRLPIERLVPQLRARGIPVFVDGAHCLGQIPLNLDALGADWYIANAHKWLYSPRGSALLYASGSAAPHTRPLVTSHFIAMGFPRSFDYIGSRDYTPWLTVPAALDFFEELGVNRVQAHNTELVRIGSAALQRIGAQPTAPIELTAAMRAFVLPQTRPATDADAAAVTRGLWEQERIQVRCVRLNGSLLLRFCAQAYVDADDLRHLAATLDQLGWPARAQ
jgi:isopenicillin-N epimerase